MSAVLVQSEREFQTAVIDYARRMGWKVAHFHDSRRQVKPGVLVGDADAAGFPDLVLVRDGHLIFAELKAERGKVGQAQMVWLAALRIAAAEQEGFDVRVWRPSDWREIERMLARSRS